MRLVHVIFMFLLVLLWVIFFTADSLHNVMNIFGITGASIASILGYILVKYFEDKGIMVIDRCLEFLKLRKPGISTIKVADSDQRLQGLLNLLRNRMITLCESKLSLIEQGELKYIEQLNWNIKTRKYDGKFVGSLSELISEKQVTPFENFVVTGEAGVGKTSATYSFLLNLLKRGDCTLVPVYFSLASWKKNQNMEQWLVQELDRNYHIHNKHAEILIQSYKIFPFLDGLDQMSQELREKCILEIYYYSKVNPLALTSRPRVLLEVMDYLRRKDIFVENVFHIYELTPLSSRQVEEITDKLNESSLYKEVFSKSTQLKTFARYPIGLFILTQIIKDLSQADLSALEGKSTSEIFYILWNKYDELVYSSHFFHDNINDGLKAEKIRYWLKKIASQKDTSFFVEELQPDFLNASSSRKIYCFLSRLLQAMVLSVSGGLFMSGAFDLVLPGIFSGIVIAVVALYFSKWNTPENEVAEYYRYLTSKSKWKLFAKNTLRFLVPLLIILGVYFGFSAPRASDFAGEMKIYNTFSMTEANVGILLAILMAIFMGFRASWQHRSFDNRMVERLSQDWGKFVKYGLTGGLLLGLFLNLNLIIIQRYFNDTGFAVWFDNNQYFQNPYLFALIAGILPGFFLFGIFGFLKEGEIKLDKLQKENVFHSLYGLRKTFKNALRAGFCILLLMSFLFGIISILAEGDFSVLLKSLRTAIAFSVLGFLWFGGLDLIGHYSLRLIIFLERSGPLNFLHFLEQSSNLRFIRVNGSSYEFTHPTIKEYFIQKPLKEPVTKRANSLVMLVILALGLFSGTYNLFTRFTDQKFWQAESDGIEIVSHSRYVNKKTLSNSIIITNDTDSLLYLKIEVTGKIKIGTFSGRITADGTEAGFFGMRMSDIYDKSGWEKFSHAALIISKNGEPVCLPSTDIHNLFSTKRKLVLPVRNKDELYFSVNDNEFQNNMGSFQVTIDTIDPNKPFIIAHRGLSGNHPENTLEAIKESLAMGADQIEIDVQATRDNILILMHDKNIRRTTTGRGKVRDLNFQEIQNSRIKVQADKIYRVPKLEEVLKLIQESETRLLIEVKHPEQFPTIGSQLVSLIESYKCRDQVEIFSFDKEFAKMFKKTNPDYTVGAFVIFPYGAENLQGLDAAGVYYPLLLIRKKFRKELEAQGLKTYAWTVNSESAMLKMLEMKVDGIITDHPRFLLGCTGKIP